MRHLLWHLHPFRWRQFIAVSLLFAGVGWHSATQLATAAEATIWDAWILALLGPRPGRIVLMDLTGWLIFYVVFLYLIGDMVNADLLTRGHDLLPRLGGRRRWWAGKLIALAMVVTFYTAEAFAAILLGASTRLPTTPTIHDPLFGMNSPVGALPLLTDVFLLVTSTLFSLAVLQWSLAARWRQSLLALLAVLCLVTFSLFVGANQLISARWLPGTQSILAWHTLFNPDFPGFSIEWSIRYNSILIAFLLVVSTWRISRLDIFSNRTYA